MKRERKNKDNFDREWKNIRKLISKQETRFYLEKKLELLDLCLQYDEIKKLGPFISISRLLLSKIDWIELTNISYGCLYYYDEHYVVSNYDNTNKYFFKDAVEAIEFLKENMPLG
jgi:hypothetical protein